MGLTLLLSFLALLAAPAATLQFGGRGAMGALAAVAIVLAANFVAGQLGGDPEFVLGAEALAIWLAIAAAVVIGVAYISVRLRTLRN